MKLNKELLAYALDKVLEEERILNTYLNNDDYNEQSKLLLLWGYIRKKYQYYFKDSKNIFIFICGILILIFIIILSVLAISAKKKKMNLFKTVEI